MAIEGDWSRGRVVVSADGSVSASNGIPYRRVAKNPDRKRLREWLHTRDVFAVLYSFGDDVESIDIATGNTQLDAVLQNYVGGVPLNESRLRGAGWPKRDVFTAEIWTTDEDADLPTVVVFHRIH